MPTSKHTPGPWKVAHHSHINKEQWLSILNGAWDITSNGASAPAVVACSKYSAMTDKENLANAHLIAAAPELLAVLKDYEETGLIDVGACRKAISKAEGKTTDENHKRSQ